VHDSDRVIVEVLNKIDLLEPDVAKAILVRNQVRSASGGEIAVSARDGRGCDALLHLLDRLLGNKEQTLRLTLAPEDGAGLAWAYANGRVIDRRSGEKGLYLVIAADPETVERFTARFPDHITIVEDRQGDRMVSS